MQTKKDKLSVLLAETVLFFANCDGEYDDKERIFINNFINSLILQKYIIPETKELIENIKPNELSIEKITEKTESLILELPTEEKQPFIEAMHGFIKNLIKADGKVVLEEKKYLEIWENKVLNL